MPEPKIPSELTELSKFVGKYGFTLAVPFDNIRGLGYIGHTIWPPGVPAALKPLVGIIEFISNIVVRPFSLTVRLFANMLAGHILLVTFALLTESLIKAQTKVFMLKPMAILPFFMLVFLTAFEVLVAFLQAYIFTILTAVYIGGSSHAEH